MTPLLPHKKSRETAVDLYPEFRAALGALLPSRKSSLLIACSGGPDSMALWDLAERWEEETGGRVVLGHINHGLRGRASDADERFVRAESSRRHTPFFSAAVPVKAFARREGRSLEDAARVLRYRALARLARAAGCPVVAAAHTLDDQAETVFLHLLRGTGPLGLAGMPPSSPWPVPNDDTTPEHESLRRPRLLRPLLSISKSRLRAYLKSRRIPFRVDASNDSPVFLRNRIRPILKKWEALRPGLRRRIARLSEIQRDEEAHWTSRWRREFPSLFRRKNAALRLEPARFKRYDRCEQRRLLRAAFRRLDFDGLEKTRALALSPGPTGRVSVPGGWIEKKGRALVFRPYTPKGPSATTAAPRPQRLSVPGRISFRDAWKARHWEIRAEPVKRLPRDWRRDPLRVYVDADRLGATLFCRTWRPGDRFQPLGLAGRKKLQDFFVDEKLPRQTRKETPLLENSNGIVWVVGHRIADAVKLTPRTRRLLKLEARRELSA
ncbi:MAG TPA: tRNA lysidine(34) synthetase TilS [Elusimicrobiota bacterium]|nr:tRNA lysidine(34) synthetase TilS [Elusimicrobiota bacterium]